MTRSTDEVRPGIEFKMLVRPRTPNTYLVCRPEHSAAKADELAPSFALAPQELFEAVQATLPHEPRVTVLAEDAVARRLVLVQRSRLFRFPDTVTIQVFPSTEGGATLAIYSASRYGHSDLGVNRARVRRWLARIAEAAGRLA